MMGLHTRSKGLLSNQKGSFTIEASLVFPIIFFITIMLLFLSLYVYQKSTLYYWADLTAKRAAWTWDNTHKNPATGEFNPYEKSESGQQAQNDGLYWRFGDFNILQIITFQFSDAVSPKQLAISSSDRSLPAAGGDKVTYKMQKVTSLLPKGISGTISYENKFYKRKVAVKLENPLKMPDFIKALFRSELVEAEASAFVTEPTEFIRNVDFVMYLGKKLSKNTVGANATTIGTILAKPK